MTSLINSQPISVNYQELLAYSGFSFTEDARSPLGVPGNQPPRYTTLFSCQISINSSNTIDCTGTKFWKELIIPEFGICGIFNSNNDFFKSYNVVLSVNPGMMWIETISQVYYNPILMTENSDLLLDFVPKNWAGTAIRIYDWESSISWAQDYKICPGGSLCDIKLREVIFTDNTESYGGCYANVTTLQEDCYSICYLREYAEKCCLVGLDSLESSLPYKHDNLKYATNQCNVFAGEHNCSILEGINRCTNQCGTPCITKYFEVDYNHYPLWKKGDLYQSSIKPLIDSVGSFNTDRDTYQVSSLTIGINRYKRPYYEDINVKQTFPGLISAIGGQLGLWGGMSIITLLEYFELIFAIFAKAIKR